MKLVFDSEEEDGQRGVECAMRGAAMASVLWDFDQWLRGKIKYGNGFKTVDEALETVREELRILVDEAGVRSVVES